MISLQEIRAAQVRIKDTVIRTPLIKLNKEPLEIKSTTPLEIYLKLENLQAIGSFKLRGAGNAILKATDDQLKNGVYTASAGNMAQGVAFHCREKGIKCTVIVPDHAPQTKLDAIERLGGKIIKVSFDEWWKIIQTHEYPGQEGYFIHPVSNLDVMAGNGTIGLEILEDLPDVDAVVIPFGGGGLSSSIASVVRALKPATRLYGAEVETAAPLKASLDANSPREVDYTPSFVDGIGGKSVLEEIWPRVSVLLDDSLVVTLAQVKSALKLMLERNRVLAEGAGATPVACALAGMAGGGKVVCVVSGGNIDMEKLLRILSEPIAPDE